MRKKVLLNLDNITLDKKVKIQGTQFDRKRKLTDKDVKHIKKLLKKGSSVHSIAKMYEVSDHTIKYNTSPDYREYSIAQRSGEHYGNVNITLNDRVEYKRDLIKTKAIKAHKIN